MTLTSKPRPCVHHPHCDKWVAAGSEFDECAGCRARKRYWKQQRPAQWFKYRRRVAKFASRMDLLISESNVTMLKKRKA